jgi:hypothetical protein
MKVVAKGKSRGISFEACSDFRAYDYIKNIGDRGIIRGKRV